MTRRLPEPHFSRRRIRGRRSRTLQMVPAAGKGEALAVPFVQEAQKERKEAMAAALRSIQRLWPSPARTRRKKSQRNREERCAVLSMELPRRAHYRRIARVPRQGPRKFGDSISTIRRRTTGPEPKGGPQPGVPAP